MLLFSAQPYNLIRLGVIYVFMSLKAGFEINSWRFTYWFTLHYIHSYGNCVQTGNLI